MLHESDLSMSVTTDINKGDVIIADDNTANVQILANMLSTQGYKVRPVTRSVLVCLAPKRLCLI